MRLQLIVMKLQQRLGRLLRQRLRQRLQRQRLRQRLQRLCRSLFRRVRAQVSASLGQLLLRCTRRPPRSFFSTGFCSTAMLQATPKHFASREHAQAQHTIEGLTQTNNISFVRGRRACHRPFIVERRSCAWRPDEPVQVQFCVSSLLSMVLVCMASLGGGFPIVL